MTKETLEQQSKFVFYIIMFLIPVLFFILLESGLRIFNYGRNYEPFITSQKYGSDMLVLNSNISYKYFDNINVFGSDFKTFFKVKPKGSYRIFVLGESSAQGFPYNTMVSFPNYIKRRLDLLYPKTEIEVVNLGASAISSFTLLDLVPAVLKHEPDLILIYAGHNEYYGALGAASTMSVGQNRHFINLIVYLRQFKTVELLRNLLSASKKKAADHIPLMQKMIGESTIPLGSDTYQSGIDNFEGNMNNILARIREANVPVLIATLTSNIRDQKPFVSVQKVKTLDADDYFLKGHLLLEKKNLKEARAAFMKAKELDGLRFRAPEAINEVIEKLANKHQIPLVKIDSLFDANAMHGIVGNDLMSDHLHPNYYGYHLLAKGFIKAMERNELLPKGYKELLSVEQQDSVLLATLPYTRLDSLKSQYIIAKMLSAYPFVPEGEGILLEKLKPKKFVDKMALQGNVDSARAVVAYYYFKEQKVEAFKREINALINHSRLNDVNYANTLILLKRDDLLFEATAYIESELRMQKPDAAVYSMLAFLWQMNGDFFKAASFYGKAIERRPNNESLYFKRAIVYQSMQEYAAAIQDYSKAITLKPDFIEAFHNRGALYYQLNAFDKCIHDFDTIIDLDPANAMAFLTRGHARFEKGDRKGGCNDWLKASGLGLGEAKRTYENDCR